MEHSDTRLMLKGYGLTTAEFFYRIPDYRNVLNSFSDMLKGWAIRTCAP